VLEEIVTDRISIGDYILSGGELAAMVVIEACVRLLPGVLSNPESCVNESHSFRLLEHPQYTRPRVWRGRQVPEQLISGDHDAVERFRLEQAIARTRECRGELLG